MSTDTRNLGRLRIPTPEDQREVVPAIPATTSTTDLLGSAFARSHFQRQSEPVIAIPSPLDGWNRHCRDEGGGIGLALGWYVIVGGATGHGKSILALNAARRAIEAGYSIGFVSLEMSPAQLSTRMYAILTGAEVRYLERGREFSPELAAEVTSEVACLRERTGARFLSNRDPVFDLSDVLKLMAYFASEGCRLLVVDYLQLVTSGDEREISREVTRISHAMRLFAKKHAVVVLGLSQFNRQTSANRTESPFVQGLIGSSSLENDADQVLLLDHSRYQRGPHTAKTFCVLGKNRHGGTGAVPVEWDYRTLRLREALPDEQDSWPERNGVRP